MSCLAKSRFQYVKSDTNNVYVDDDDNVTEDEDGDEDEEDEDEEDFNFRYESINQFKNIIKDVRRQRIQDEEEDKAWTSYLKQEPFLTSNCQKISYEPNYKSNRTLAESFEEVERELKFLNVDALPEDRNPSIYSSRQHSPVTIENSASSTNLLLSIPEEQKYRSKSSEQSYKPNKRYIKKTCSDRTLKKNQICTTSHNFSTNDLDYNSSPERSSNQLSNENDSIFERPDPLVITKILGYQRKISTVLDLISNELDRIPLPDGEDDLHRRQQRAAEFSTRISRNYLYDLSRRISDIQRHIKAINPDGKTKLSRRGIILHMQAIEQKLISTHQLLLTALTAYWKHIPTSVLKNYPGKVKEILQILEQLKTICTELNLLPDCYCSGDDRDTFFGKETETQCNIILSKFRLISDNESQVPSHTTRSTTTSYNKKQRNRKTLSNRLSMYSMDFRLGRNYPPKKSRTRSLIPKDRKHNSLLSKHQQRNILPASKKLHLSSQLNSSNETNRNKGLKISIPMKEDDIQTMMETFPSDLDLDSHQSLRSDKKSESNRVLHKSTKILDNKKECEPLSKCRLNSNNGKILKNNRMEENYSSNFLYRKGEQLIKNRSNNSNLLPSSTTDIVYNLPKKIQPKVDSNGFKRYNKNQSEIGTQNVQSICYSRKDDKEENDQFIDLKEHEELLTFNDASCQANYLKSSGLFKLSISESLISSFIDYRNQYQCLLNSSPLYASNSQNKPWEVVAWIADKLVDEMIVELSNDFQMEEILQKLVDLEFQEF